MDTILAFVAALVALRLTGELVKRYRSQRAHEHAIWAASLAAFGLAAAALAWGSAAGWDDRAFRTYYLFGGLLTAPLLGLGSLARARRPWATPAALAYAGLAVGVMLAVPVGGVFGPEAIPDAQDHLDLVPARLLALAANGIGTLVVVLIAVLTLRSRLSGNLAILAGVAVAAVGSGLSGLGVGESAVSLAVAAGLLYAGFVLGNQPRERSQRPPTV